MRYRTFVWLVAACAVVAAAGCASTASTDLSNDLAVAQSAITAAEDAGAAESSPAELRAAREKLEAANRLMQEEEFVQAEWRAEEAIVDAELAAAKARSEAAAESARAIQQDIETLRREALDE